MGAPLSPHPRGCRLRPSPHGAGMAPKGAGQRCSRGGGRLRASSLSFGRPRFVLPHIPAPAPVAWHPQNGARILPGAASVSPADRQDERCPIPPSRGATWGEVFGNGAHGWLYEKCQLPNFRGNKGGAKSGLPRAGGLRPRCTSGCRVQHPEVLGAAQPSPRAGRLLQVGSGPRLGAAAEGRELSKCAATIEGAGNNALLWQPWHLLCGRSQKQQRAKIALI